MSKKKKEGKGKAKKFEFKFENERQKKAFEDSQKLLRKNAKKGLVEDIGLDGEDF